MPAHAHAIGGGGYHVTSIDAPFLNLARNTRVLGVGPTRCGKSHLFRAILIPQRHVIVVDSKHRWTWDIADARYRRIVYTIEELVEALRAVEAAGDGAPVVFRPRRLTFEDFDRGTGLAAKERNRDLNRLWWLALERGWTLVYHDELSLDVSPTAFDSLQPMWRELVVTGEGLGVGMYAASQRPKRIPLIASTEASNRFTFFLRDRSDQDTVQSYLGAEIPWDVLARNRHSFVWANDELTHSYAPLVPMRLAA
jgi:hypothetical protein